MEVKQIVLQTVAVVPDMEPIWIDVAIVHCPQMAMEMCDILGKEKKRIFRVVEKTTTSVVETKTIYA